MTLRPAWSLCLLSLLWIGTGCKSSEDGSDAAALKVGDVDNATGKEEPADVEVTNESDATKNGFGLAGNNTSYYNNSPFVICNTLSCDSGYYRNYDSQIFFTFYDNATGKALANQTFTFRIFDQSIFKADFRETFVSDRNGKVVSGKIANARGASFQICMTSDILSFIAGNLLISSFSGDSNCYTGTLSRYTKDTVNGNIRLSGTQNRANLVEIIATGSYCPQNPIIVTGDTYELSIPGLGLLGTCRNLDSQVFASIVDNTTGAQISGAKVTVDVDPTASTSLSGVYTSMNTNAAINVTSDKFSRVRGKGYRVCASADGYADHCVTGTLSATTKDTRIQGANSIKLYPNKKLVAQVDATGSTDANGSYLIGTTFKGLVFDPDHTGILTVKVSANGVERKTFTTDTYSQDACTNFNVCDASRLVGFQVTMADLNLPFGESTLTFSSFNRAEGAQPTEEGAYVTIAQFTVNNIAPAYGALRIDNVTYNTANVTLTRVDTSKDENIVIDYCLLVNNAISACYNSNANFVNGAATASFVLPNLKESSTYGVGARTGDHPVTVVNFATPKGPTPPAWVVTPTLITRNSIRLSITRANVAPKTVVKVNYQSKPDAKGKTKALSASVTFNAKVATMNVLLKSLAPGFTYNFRVVVNNTVVAAVPVATQP